MSTQLFQAARVEPYGSSLELLAAETQRLQLLLDRQAQLLRFQGTINESNEFQGMFLQESEIDALLTHAGAADSPFLTRVAALDEQIVRLRLEIDRRAQASEEAGIPLSLPHLVRAFGLDPFERDVVLMALAPELDLKFHKLYSYVQNDFTRKRPSINLAINLLRDTFEERVAAREYFSPESPLLRYRMLLLDAAPQGAELTLLTREFKLADRVISFLTGRRTLDENVADFSRLLIPTALLDQVVLPEGTVQHVRGILAATLADPPRLPEDWPVLLFHGPRGAGKKLLAEALARELNRSQVLGLLQQDPEAFLRGTPGRGASGGAEASAGLVEEQVEALIAERAAARARKDWKEADRVRKVLSDQGIVLEDGAGGTTWRRA